MCMLFHIKGNAELSPKLKNILYAVKSGWTNTFGGMLNISFSVLIEVKIIEIDTAKRRISLSYCQTLENPWDVVTKKSPVGSIVNCKLNNITDFGLFVSIDSSDLIGMIHFKDLAWNENYKS